MKEEQLIAEVLYGEETADRSRYALYENGTYMVISKFAYLIGVPFHIFENEHEPPKMEWYEALEKDKNARIIRNLCMLRTAFERNYRNIFQAMRYDLKGIASMPEYIPRECIDQLSADGLSIYRANAQPIQYIIDINNHIANRINNCKNLFPIWLNWSYIRQLFIMPGGTTEKGAKGAAADYYAHNEDYFTDMSKVTDAGLIAKNGIYDFLERSNRTAIVVDCENADPYKLYATLNNLDQAALLGKISKIILYDDVHTTTAWKILEKFTQIPIEHNMIERIKENKSLVDIRLTTGTCREFFQNDTDSFILASSDSDYWGLISAMPEAHFLVLVESDKCGPDIKRAMIDAGITYCYMDDFCTGNSDEIRIQAVLNEVRKSLDEAVHFNIQELFQEAIRRTRAELSIGEQAQFYDRYLRPMRLNVDKEGNVEVLLGPL